MWKTAVYDDPFEPPRWTAVFDYGVPEGLLGAFHQALDADYTAGDGYLSSDQPLAAAYLPLLNAGWTHAIGDRQQAFTAPGKLARLTHTHGLLRDDSFGWRLLAGPADSGGHWTAAFTARRPPQLIAAFTRALASPEPLARTADQLPLDNRPHLTITPTPAPTARTTNAPPTLRVPDPALPGG
ncbi:DUF317 domain-containing protein [Actinacidiphila oryziradicis]|uniref:DUF317 domain-containing protein n=1 Tax=Actinacidiphila oryziradicis TaxID=2571141 RepID=A0A4U0RV69_9ACTN|nr:DUF317 domain-containing protein [Actinacidiphila oryziradicis]